MFKYPSNTVKLLALVPAAFLAFVAILGCADAPSSLSSLIDLEALKSGWVLAEEPDGAMTPLDLRDMIDEGQEAPKEVVFVGNVGGMPNPWPDQFPEFPWVKDKSTFFLVDPSTMAEFACHLGEEGDIEDLEAHAEECPFCAREAANQSKSIAAISFVDDAGKPYPADIQKLFGLSKGDVVVVQGKIDQINDGLILVNADGIHRR